MRAAICRAFGQPLTIEEITCDPPGPGEIEVKLAACAICHSDILYAEGAWGGELPAVYGHEAAGVVTKVGAGVLDLAPGDHDPRGPERTARRRRRGEHVRLDLPALARDRPHDQCRAGRVEPDRRRRAARHPLAAVHDQPGAELLRGCPRRRGTGGRGGQQREEQPEHYAHAHRVPARHARRHVARHRCVRLVDRRAAARRPVAGRS